MVSDVNTRLARNHTSITDVSRKSHEMTEFYHDYENERRIVGRGQGHTEKHISGMLRKLEIAHAEVYNC